MKLSAIIRQARNSEVKQLSSKDKTDEVLIDYINLAVDALYRKFDLVMEEAIITLVPGKTIYSLDGTDADVSLGSSNELMGIVNATDERGPIAINDDVDEFSIYTIGFDSVQIPLTSEGSFISLIYKPYPELIEYVDSGDGSAVDVDVRVPRGLMQALLYYMGFKAHGSVNGIDGERNSYMSAFTRECQAAVEEGIVPRDAMSRDVKEKGFM